MGIMEILLLIAGAVIFALSFIIPVQKEEISEETKTLAKKEIEVLVSKKMDDIKSHVDDVVEETVEYTMEKTERTLERLSNEKIMAVNEYSDTVLQEIHRNHEEVMFLYDMLNDKHTNLKNTVSEVNKTVKEVAETKKEAEAVVSTFQKLTPESVAADEAKVIEQNTGVEMDISFTNDTDEQGRNCNERILELHRQGKSKVAIAKELGLGVGEVKLVIDLYQNM